MEEIIFDCLEEITGISKDDFMEDDTLDLIDSGILDSLSLVSLMDIIGDTTGKRVTLKDFDREDFISINAFIRKAQFVLQ